MLPPGFVKYWDGKGLHRPYCWECIHFADERFTMRGICWEFGAYVSLYSSCKDFVRRVMSDTPIVTQDDIKISHRLGLNDLVK
jgi:hypothetical protein